LMERVRCDRKPEWHPHKTRKNIDCLDRVISVELAKEDLIQ
jgi:hypothetical protein